MLLNLLIAQITSAYDGVREQSREFRQLQRALMVLEYKDQRAALPLFTFIVALSSALRSMANRLCGRTQAGDDGVGWRHPSGFKLPMQDDTFQVAPAPIPISPNLTRSRPISPMARGSTPSRRSTRR